MRIAFLLAGVSGLFIGLSGCAETDACDEYIQYMCDCHPEADCEALERQYGEADAATQDDCALELDDQEEVDETSAHTCGDTTGSGTATGTGTTG